MGRTLSRSPRDGCVQVCGHSPPLTLCLSLLLCFVCLNFIYLFIYFWWCWLFIAAQVVVHGLLIAMASFVAEHGL